MSVSVVDDKSDEVDGPVMPTAEEILNGLHGKIEPIRTTGTYRLGIIAVWIVMVLLPLIYIALIAFVAYGVYWHTVNNVGMLQQPVRGRGQIFIVTAYLAPLVAGSIMVLFMMKPLFARGPKRPKTQSLTREQEPLLFGFIDRVCEAVGSPIPRQIDIDCQVNASASFRHGFWSMLKGNDLVLTIGMPLVMGFSLRQFAGVLAHEFGHFSQAAGMRLTYIIRSINFWFTRVVYERDAWDIWLESTAKGLDLRLSWVLHLARFFVWLSRRCLWVLMIIGHAVSGYLMRQMEYDADRHECRLAGSDLFESTVRRLIELNIGNSRAQQDLHEFYREGRLADDLPGLILFNVQQFPSEYQAKITEIIEKSKTGYFDTHPADVDRIKNAEAEHATGIFQTAGPASILFRDATDGCRVVTTDYYQQIFGDQFRREAVHPLEDLLVRQKAETESLKALGRYLQGTFNLLRPLPIPNESLASDHPPDLTSDQLAKDREFIVTAAPAFRSAFQQFDEIDLLSIQTECAFAVLSANEKIDPKHFSFSASGISAVKAVTQQASSKVEAIKPDLEAFEVRAKARFTAALKLLFDPHIVSKLDDAANQQADCQRFLIVLQALSRLIPPTMKMRNARAALGVLFSYVKQDGNTNELIEQIKHQAGEIHTRLIEIHGELAPLTYPFDHAQGTMSMADFVVKVIPEIDDYGGLYSVAETAMENMGSLINRLMGRLALIAERVEAATGLPPLPVPKDDAATQPDAAATSATA